jgi:hypothetical protein
MPFDRVATRLACVTGPEVDRDPEPRARVGIAAVVRRDVETVGLEMLDPVMAAAARRSGPDFDASVVGGAQPQGRRRKRNE